MVAIHDKNQLKRKSETLKKEPTKGGVKKKNKQTKALNKAALYQRCLRASPVAIQALKEEAQNPSKLGAIRVAAARTLLAKVIPDIKALEVGGIADQPVKTELGLSPAAEKFLSETFTKIFEQAMKMS